MKSYAHLQQELRQLSERIAGIGQDLEALKPQAAGKPTGTGDAGIRMLAKKFPIKNKFLKAAPEAVKASYFGILALLMAVEPHGWEHKQLFLQRIAEGVGYELEQEKLMKHRAALEASLAGGRKLDQLDMVRHSLLLDGLLTVHLAGAASTEELRMLAEFATVLGIAEEEVATLAKLARCLIHRDDKEFAAISAADAMKWRGMFIHHIPHEWLLENRVFCGDYKVVKSELSVLLPSFGRRQQGSKFMLIDKRKEGSAVKAGEVLVSYELDGKKQAVKAKRGGVVFYSETKRNLTSLEVMTVTQVYTCSCFDMPGKPKPNGEHSEGGGKG